MQKWMRKERNGERKKQERSTESEGEEREREKERKRVWENKRGKELNRRTWTSQRQDRNKICGFAFAHLKSSDD